MGGANSAALSDWSAVGDRDVTIWPDHDPQGAAYARDVARLAYAAGARRVRVVEVPPWFPAKWDLADALPDGVGEEDLATLLAGAREAHCKPDLPSGFEMREDGVWWTDFGQEEEQLAKRHWICGPFEFVAEARAAGGGRPRLGAAAALA